MSGGTLHPGVPLVPAPSPFDKLRASGQADDGSRPRFTLGPLTYVIQLSEWTAWLVDAQPGDEIIFAHGLVPPRTHEVWRATIKAVTAPALVAITAHKSDGRTFWLAQKLRVAKSADALDWRAARMAAQVDAMLRFALTNGSALPLNREIGHEIAATPDFAGRLLHERARALGLVIRPSGVGGLRLVLRQAQGERLSPMFITAERNAVHQRVKQMLFRIGGDHLGAQVHDYGLPLKSAGGDLALYADLRVALQAEFGTELSDAKMLAMADMDDEGITNMIMADLGL